MRSYKTLSASVIILLIQLSPIASYDGFEPWEITKEVSPPSVGSITISGDDDLIEKSIAYGWPGSGSETDPFLISDIILETGGNLTGLHIDSTGSHIVLESITVMNASGQGNSVSPGAGIDIRGSRNITIRKCDLTKNTVGLWIEGSASIDIRNTSAENCTTGAVLRSCSGIDVRDCELHYNSAYGIRLFGSHHCNISNSRAFHNDLGMDLTVSNNNRIFHNNCSWNDDHGVRLSGSLNNTVENNTMIGNDDGVHILSGRYHNVSYNIIRDQVEYGIYLEMTRSNSIHHNSMFGCSFMLIGDEGTFTDQMLNNNTVNGLKVHYFKGPLQNGIDVRGEVGQIIAADVHNVAFGDLSVSGGSNGITIAYSTNCSVLNTTIEDMTYSGIYLKDSTIVEMFDMGFRDIFEGVAADNSQYITIGASYFENLTWGVTFQGCLFSDISDNVFSFGDHGIRLVVSRENNLTDNQFFMLEGTGIVLTESSFANLITGNRLNSCGLGMDLHLSPYTTIKDNRIIFVKDGIILKSKSCTLRNNSIKEFDDVGVRISEDFNDLIHNLLHSDTGTGIMIMSGRNTLIKNRIEMNYKTGIYIATQERNHFLSNNLTGCNFDLLGTESWKQEIPENNTVNGLPVLFLKSQDLRNYDPPSSVGQIMAVDCQNLVMEDQSMSGIPSFIYIQDCENVTIRGASTESITYPVEVVRSYNVKIDGCSFKGGRTQINILNEAVNVRITNSIFESPSSMGIDIQHLQGGGIEGCEFRGSGGAVVVDNVLDIILKKCFFHDLDEGITMDSYSDSVTITGNIFRDIKGYDIIFKGHHLSCRVQGNCFIEGENISMEEGGPVFVNNYYDDPENTKDRDGDEISDVPYPISGNLTRDLYPLTVLPMSVVEPPVIRLEQGEPPNVSVDISARGLDFGLENMGVEIYNETGEVVLKTDKLNGNASFPVDSEGRDYRFNARTITELGNSMLSEERGLILDWNPPEIEFTFPNEGALLNESGVIIRWKLHDNASSIEGVNISVDGGKPVELGYSMGYQISNIGDGHHTVKIWARDSSNRSSSRALHFTVDTTPPEILVTEPEDGSYINDKVVTLKWSLEDFSGIRETWVNADGGDWVPGKLSQHAFRFLEEGVHVLRVRTVDNAGIESVGSVSITIDRTPPEVIDFRPKGGNVSKDADPYVKLSEPVPDTLITVYIDGGMVDRIVSGAEIWIVTTESFQPGSSHLITINATDTAGNIMEPFTWSFLVKSPPENIDEGAEFWGEVVDEEGDPIRGAVIFVGGEEITDTDDSGIFRIYLRSGTHELEIHASGYNDRTFLINATQEEKYLGKFELKEEETSFPWGAVIAITLIWALLVAGIITYLRTSRNFGTEE